MINLRSATPADVDLLRYWDEQPHIKASDPNDDWGWEVELNRDPEVTAILIDPLASNTRAQRFYERLGFQFIESRRFGEDDCFVYRLNRVDWEG